MTTFLHLPFSSAISPLPPLSPFFVCNGCLPCCLRLCFDRCHPWHSSLLWLEPSRVPAPRSSLVRLRTPSHFPGKQVPSFAHFAVFLTPIHAFRHQNRFPMNVPRRPVILCAQILYSPSFAAKLIPTEPLSPLICPAAAVLNDQRLLRQPHAKDPIVHVSRRIILVVWTSGLWNLSGCQN